MPETVRILGIGDIVGKPGRNIVRDKLADFCRENEIDGVVGNGENISGGAGILPKEADILLRNGVDVITGGDHIWNKRDIMPYIETSNRLIRPANYPKEQPGRGSTVVTLRNGEKMGVIHVQGRVFMNVPAACPFTTAKELVAELKKETKLIIVDIHCEATSEKVAMGWWLDGEVSFVFGTHTHIQTADERVLPKGTAYITDCGMTGPYESIIGRRVDRVLHRMVTGLPARFDVAEGDVRLCGAVATIRTGSGLAEKIERVVIRLDDHA